MKDLSFFLLKNAFGSKMKKGFRNSCTGDDSTSTANNLPQPLPQQRPVVGSPGYSNYHHHHHHAREKSEPTLEEMIVQLELEERAARLDGEVRHRMSCVNSSDILRSARNALNQYPRFSLDGKDAMYRSSFRNNMIPAATANQGRLRKGLLIQPNTATDLEVGRNNRHELPTTIAGERVVWCRPGVVGKLMGLEVIPIPVRRYRRLNAVMKREHDNHHHPPGRRWRDDDWAGKEKEVKGSCSKTGYCYLKPVRRADRHPPPPPHGESGWPMRRFR